MGPLCCLALQQGGLAVKLEGMVACLVSKVSGYSAALNLEIITQVVSRRRRGELWPSAHPARCRDHRGCYVPGLCRALAAKKIFGARIMLGKMQLLAGWRAAHAAGRSRKRQILNDMR